MKSYLFLFFLIVFSGSLNAKKPLILKLSDEKLRTRIPFQITDVVDLRTEKDYIGIFPGSDDTNKKMIITKLTFKESITRLIQNSLHKSVSDSKITVVVDRLLTVPYPYSPNTSYTEVKLRFFKKEDSGYVQIFEIGQTYVLNILSVKDRFTKGIILGLTDCFKAFEEAYNEGTLSSVRLSKRDTSFVLENPIVYPITEVARYKRGVYFSFHDFRMNNPDTTFDFELKHSLKKDSLVEADIEWKQDMDKYSYHIWGVSDGERLYIKFNDRYQHIEPREEGLVVKKVNPKPEYPVGNFVSAFVGGAVGGIIFNLWSSSSSIEGERIVENKIDLASGILEMTNKEMDEYKPKKRLMIYNSQFNIGDAPVIVTIDDKINYDLPQAQYIITELPEENQTVKVCLSIENTNHCESISVKKIDLYSYTIRAKKKGTIELKENNDRILNTIIDDTKSGEISREILTYPTD